MPAPAITAADVEEAARTLSGVAHHTPVLTSRTLDRRLGARVRLKAENLQRVGAFKIRGAYNRMAALSRAELSTGVIAYSSGNHAQAVALSATLLGTRATILMPEDTPAPKLAATREYGAEVVTYDRYRFDREELGGALAAERGLVLIPPYEHPLVMAGQGTVALELLDDAGPVEVFVAPLGGGGLMAGCSTIVRHRCPDALIVGVEPEHGDDWRRSLEAGERVAIDVPRTVADGLQAHTPGELTFAVNRRTIDRVVAVTDEEILRAMRFAWERLKVVVEPSGAVGIAALLEGRIDVRGSAVGVVLSGGNASPEVFARALTSP